MLRSRVVNVAPVSRTWGNSMHWELWHRKSGNMIDDFATLSDGLDFVAGELASGGHKAVLGWELISSEEGVPSLRDEDLVLTAMVAQGNVQTSQLAPTPLAERIAHRFQQYEEHVQALERQLAAASGRTN
jgi:hypothetical protein